MSHDVEDHQIPTTLVTSLIHLAAIDEPRRPGMTVFDWTDHTRRHMFLDIAIMSGYTNLLKIERSAQ